MTAIATPSVSVSVFPPSVDFEYAGHPDAPLSGDTTKARNGAGRLLRDFRAACAVAATVKADKNLSTAGVTASLAKLRDSMAPAVDSYDFGRIGTVLRSEVPAAWADLRGRLWPDTPGALARLQRELDSLMRFDRGTLGTLVAAEGTRTRFAALIAHLPEIELDELRGTIALPASTGSFDALLQFGTTAACAASRTLRVRAGELAENTEALRRAALIASQVAAKVRSGDWTESPMGGSTMDHYRAVRRTWADD